MHRYLTLRCQANDNIEANVAPKWSITIVQVKMAARTDITSDSNGLMSSDLDEEQLATSTQALCMDTEDFYEPSVDIKEELLKNASSLPDGVKEAKLDRESCTVRCNHCNGNVAGLEVAVEAHPDLVFESDLVSPSQDAIPMIQPRVYLERESFSHEKSVSDVSSVRLRHYKFSHRLIQWISIAGNEFQCRRANN